MNMKTTQQIQMEQVPIGELRPDPAKPRRVSDRRDNTEGLLYDYQRDGHIGPEDVLYIYEDGSRERISRKAADRSNRNSEVIIKQEVKENVTDSREPRPAAQRSRVMPGAKHHQTNARRTAPNKRVPVLSADSQRQMLFRKRSPDLVKTA